MVWLPIVIALVLLPTGKMEEHDLQGKKAFDTYQECMVEASKDASTLVQSVPSIIGVTIMCQESQAT